LRANAEGTEQSEKIRPQADSYSANAVCTERFQQVRPQADSCRRERFDAFWKVRPQSKPAVGARLRANAEGKSLCCVRPQADSYSANAACTAHHENPIPTWVKDLFHQKIVSDPLLCNPAESPQFRNVDDTGCRKVSIDPNDSLNTPEAPPASLDRDAPATLPQTLSG